MLMTSRPTPYKLLKTTKCIDRLLELYVFHIERHKKRLVCMWLYVSEVLSLLPRVTRQITKIYFNTSRQMNQFAMKWGNKNEIFVLWEVFNKNNSDDLTCMKELEKKICWHRVFFRQLVQHIYSETAYAFHTILKFQGLKYSTITIWFR